MTAVCLSSKIGKKVVDAAADYAIPSTKMVKPNRGGQLFKTDIDMVKHEKRPTVPEYVNELPG